MSRYIVYGAGLLVVALVVGLLVLLTIDNATSGQAIFGNRFSSFRVTGPASILINIGILGMVGSLLTFISYIFSRRRMLLRSYQFLGAASGLIIFIGWIWGQS